MLVMYEEITILGVPCVLVVGHDALKSVGGGLYEGQLRFDFRTG